MKTVYLVFRTDKWHSYASRKLVYVGDDLDCTIAQIEAHTECTKEQAEQLREYCQSQCNEGVDYEFDIEEVEVNTFI
ncbi:MAG: hypothetical protein II670_08525 [Alphaproteobacteria bacterium]|nr:hypothetical protein [Alphaproteobacteria bacterium]